MNKSQQKRYDSICKKQWDKINQDDLFFLYVELDLIKAEIANIYNITKGKVSYKLQRFGIRKTSKIITDVFNNTLSSVRNEALKEMVFGYDSIIDSPDNYLSYGPVIVTRGPHKGRIGVYDDNDDYDKNGYVYFGNMVSTLDSCYLIPLTSLSNNITTYRLSSRVETLSNELGYARAKRASGKLSIEKENMLIELYREYVLALQLLNKVYVETNFLHSKNNERIFLSHSSADLGFANVLASDLKLAGYDVWLDRWEIGLGQSIPESISNGLDTADALIILLSKDYLKSVFCRDEWQGYYMKYKAADARIITIIIDDSTPPTILASRKYFRFNESRSYETLLIELKRSLNNI